MSITPTIWTLRSGNDRRFKAGHPWVFSNELSQSPKGIPGGSPVELRSPRGDFLAWGYGNPPSLIAFRELSRDRGENCFDSAFLARRLAKALQLRTSMGLGEVSYRWAFGEADGLPGLIVDRYLIAEITPRQVIVVQAHTAGAHQWTENLLPVFESIISRSPIGWDDTAVLLKNDLSVRTLEGLQEEEPRWLKKWSTGEPAGSHPIWVGMTRARAIPLWVDFSAGQKTAFFLDQNFNIDLVQKLILQSEQDSSAVKVLDLFSYVGQWGARIAHALEGRTVEVTAVDSSKTALELAQKNLKSVGAQAHIIKMDILEKLQTLPEIAYDIVICDPPALIKGRKNLEAGKHGYLKLNEQALRRVKSGGWFVSCSCSGIFSETEFIEMLSKASRRAARPVQWISRGAHSGDHPVLTEFPEGHYLKCWVGRVS